MKPGNKVFSITYLVAYALTSSHHSIDYKKKEYIEMDDLFTEIGSVEGSKFATIKPIDETWAINIAKDKRLIVQSKNITQIAFLQGYEPLEDIYEDEEDVFYLETKEIIIASSSEEENSDHEDSVRKITNPKSIYVQGDLKFKENSPREITATIANGSGKFILDEQITTAYCITVLMDNFNERNSKTRLSQAIKKEAQNYYDSYKGPTRRYTHIMGVTEAFCKTDKVTCKKIKSREQAEISLILYGEEKQKTVLLRPRIHQVKEEHKDQRLKITEETPLGLEPIIEFDEFKQLWNKAKAACQEDFIHERLFTTDKTTKSLYNFIEGADPNIIHQAFQSRIDNNIYPEQ
ncbi:retrotransposon protein, putative, ty3-gypsy subclass [Tanacetum coccineum]